MTKDEQTINVSGRRLVLSNLDKVFYPGGQFTKAQVIDYYVRVSKYLLPHLQRRPLTLKRFPNGIYGEFFYEKDAPSFTPSWVKTFPVPRREGGPDIQYIIADNLPTLVWLENLANLELHPFLHRAPRIQTPTWMVFDLDPGEGADVLTCARVAILLREVLGKLGLETLAKVSGSKGLQVYVPLNTTTVTYDETQPFARAIAELLSERYPQLIVAKMPKAFRAKKVFIDWSQNDDYKTTVGVYSLRANYHRAYVSTPVEWDELERALGKTDADGLYFTPAEVLARVEERGDIFKEVLTLKQKLPPIEKPPASAGSHKQRSRKGAKRTPAESRRSRQGGRRRFAIVKRGKELLLETAEGVRVWSLSRGGLPLKKGEARSARPKQIESRSSLEPETKPWDAGVYDLIEGSYRDGFLRIHLAGQRLTGDWKLSRDKNSDGWQVTAEGVAKKL